MDSTKATMSIECCLCMLFCTMFCYPMCVHNYVLVNLQTSQPMFKSRARCSSATFHCIAIEIFPSYISSEVSTFEVNYFSITVPASTLYFVESKSSSLLIVTYKRRTRTLNKVLHMFQLA